MPTKMNLCVTSPPQVIMKSHGTYAGEKWSLVNKFLQVLHESNPILVIL